MSSKNRTNVVWETVDYQSRPVTLSSVQLDHILDTRLADVDAADWTSAIRQTIEDPDVVSLSEKYDNTEIHTKFEFADDTFGDEYLNVIVLYQVGIGDVQTAYPKKGMKKGRDVLYVKKMKL